MRLKGSAASTTQASISGIAGNASARTGDASTALAPIFDAGQVRADVGAQVAITAEFGRTASKAWADYAQTQSNALAAQARDAEQSGDTARARQLTDEARQWDEGGLYRSAGHTALGALAGGLSGAAGAASSATLMPEIGRLIDATDAPPAIRQGLGMIVSAALGGVAGGASGAASAFNTDTNNRQLHPSERQRIQDLAADKAQSTCRASTSCETQARLYWTDMLERAAQDRVDAEAASRNQAYYDQIMAAAGRAGSEASLGAAQRFFSDLGEAHRLLNASSGQTLLDAQGRPVTGTDGRPQTYFSAATAQRDNPYGNVFPGGQPGTQSSVIPGKAQRDLARLDRLNTPNGQAVPDTTLEELLIGVRVPTQGAAATVQATERQIATAVAGTAKSAEEALLRAGGALDKAGNPLLDMSKLSSEQKRLVGEQLFGPNTVRQIVPDGQQIARVQAQGSNGIDELYRVQRPDVDYVSIEYKFVGADGRTGAQVLKNTKDGKQGSESWIQGSNRIEKAVASIREVERIYDAIDAGRLESWVVTIRSDGSTFVQVLDAFGKPKPVDASRILRLGSALSGAMK